MTSKVGSPATVMLCRKVNVLVNCSVEPFSIATEPVPTLLLALTLSVPAEMVVSPE